MKLILLILTCLSLCIAGCSGPWNGLGSSMVVNNYNIGSMKGDIGTDSWADERGFGQGADLRWKSKGSDTEYVEEADEEPEAIEADPIDYPVEEDDLRIEIPDSYPAPTDIILRAIREDQRSMFRIPLLSEVAL